MVPIGRRLLYTWVCAALAGSVPIRAPASSAVMASSSPRLRVTSAAARFSRIGGGWVGGLGYHDVAHAKVPAQDNLRRGDTVFCGQCGDRWFVQVGSLT